MRCEVEVKARGMRLDEGVRAAIEAKSQMLSRCFVEIRGLRLLIEGPRDYRQHGLLTSLTLEIELPGADLVLRRELYGVLRVAVEQTFDSARELLQQRTLEQRQASAKEVERPAPRKRRTSYHGTIRI